MNKFNQYNFRVTLTINYRRSNPVLSSDPGRPDYSVSLSRKCPSLEQASPSLSFQRDGLGSPQKSEKILLALAKHNLPRFQTCRHSYISVFLACFCWPSVLGTDLSIRSCAEGEDFYSLRA
jgi:hypothetical protein